MFQLTGKADCSTKGFSLIELLVVLFVMALITAIIIPKISNSTDKIAHKEAKRFHYLIKSIQQQSIYQGKVLKVSFSDNTYNVTSLNALSAEWSADNAKALNKKFITHDIDESISVNINFFDSNAIIFYPLGQLPNFSVDFFGNDKHYRVAMQNFGALTFQFCQPDCVIAK